MERASFCGASIRVPADVAARVDVLRRRFFQCALLDVVTMAAPAAAPSDIMAAPAAPAAAPDVRIGLEAVSITATSSQAPPGEQVMERPLVVEELPLASVVEELPGDVVEELPGVTGAPSDASPSPEDASATSSPASAATSTPTTPATSPIVELPGEHGRRAVSPSTTRIHWRRFETFARERGEQAMPAARSTVDAFIATIARVGLRARVAESIDAMHRRYGFAPPGAATSSPATSEASEQASVMEELPGVMPATGATSETSEPSSADGWTPARRASLRFVLPGGRGIDVAAAYQDIRRLVLSAYPRVRSMLRARAHEGKRGRLIDVEDLIQEVAAKIHERNSMACAFDPARATFGRYVYLTMYSVATHATEGLDLTCLVGSGRDGWQAKEREDMALERLGALAVESGLIKAPANAEDALIALADAEERAEQRAAKAAAALAQASERVRSITTAVLRGAPLASAARDHAISEQEAQCAYNKGRQRIRALSRRAAAADTVSP